MNMTLSQLFKAPDGYVGQICIASALTADAKFLESLLTDFTGYSAPTRRGYGNVNLLLMTDKRQGLLDLDAVPGILQLQPNNKSLWDRVACMHAKVALMQFGRRDVVQLYGDKKTDIIWRLVVCTGNWTENSAKNQIEMAWKTDLRPSDKKVDRKSLSDIRAAKSFFMSLRKFYAVDRRIWTPVDRLFDGIEKLRDVEGDHPARFFNTLGKESILDSVKARFSKRGHSHNYVIAGSGFYEEPDGKFHKPDVIREIESELKLTNIERENRHLVVNPEKPGQVANWRHSPRDWLVLKPADPAPNSSESRFMHAKFIFAGHKTRTRIDKGRFYMGSGNLSHMGLQTCRSQNSGIYNIEAGVVLELVDICRSLPISETNLQRLLLCGDELGELKTANQDENIDFVDPKDFSGTDYREPCPLLAFELMKDGNNKTLVPVWLKEKAVKGVILQTINKTEVRSSSIPLSAAPPNYMVVIWNGCEYQIPILSCVNGTLRYPATTNQSITLEDCLSQLSSTMMDRKYGGNDSEDEDDGGPQNYAKSSDYYSRRIVEEKKYRYQTAMTLVEAVADLSQKRFSNGYEVVNEDDIQDWISVLEYRLKPLSRELITAWQEMHVNFISVLTQESFAPPCCNRKARRMWNDFIGQWAREWSLDKYEAL